MRPARSQDALAFPSVSLLSFIAFRYFPNAATTLLALFGEFTRGLGASFNLSQLGFPTKFRFAKLKRKEFRYFAKETGHFAKCRVSRNIHFAKTKRNEINRKSTVLRNWRKKTRQNHVSESRSTVFEGNLNVLIFWSPFYRFLQLKGLCHKICYLWIFIN
jgi:hypothetical protein